MKLHRRSQSKLRSRGQALVEFAIVLPVFLLVLFGLIEFGYMLYSQMTVSNAAREAARAAVVDPDACTIPQLADATARGAATGLTGNFISVSVSPIASCATAPQGTPVNVTVNYTYHTFFPLFFGATFHLSQSIQMALW
jgi:Flp pilus assembly protein TadG